MKKFSWVDAKKKLFSEILVSKMSGKTVNVNNLFQELPSPTQNKYSVKITTWNDLLRASSGLNPSIIKSSRPDIFCGFDVSDELGQKILDKAFLKVYEDFYNGLDQDEETVRSRIIEYILDNKFHEKGLHILIKKLKNLEIESLPDLP